MSDLKQEAAQNVCPRCGSADTARILYGKPLLDEAMLRRLERKEIVLGGCCIGEDSPARQCNVCGARFGSLEPPRPPAAETEAAAEGGFFMDILDKISINEHSSIRAAGEKTVYFDPFHVKEQKHDADIIFFTHAHYDHFSPQDFAALVKPGTLFVAPRSMRRELLKEGIAEENTLLLAPGESAAPCGIAVEAVPAYNIGKPMHPRRNEWLGYVVTLGGSRLYVCGDTDAIEEGKQVRCDIVLVPIGGTFTMNAKQAAAFVNAMRPRCAVPTHYGSIVGKIADAEIFRSLVDKDIEVVTKISEE